jgi:V8-like Glu-specific endopeptidase
MKIKKKRWKTNTKRRLKRKDEKQKQNGYKKEKLKNNTKWESKRQVEK